jgi:phage-related protein
MNRNIYIDDVNLNSITGFTVRRIDVEPIPRETNEANMGSSDGGIIKEQYFRPRNITVVGEIARTSHSAGQTTLDNLNILLRGTDKKIEFDYGGALRRFTGTPLAPVENDWIGGYKRIQLIFKCFDPFGYNPNYTTVSATGQTSATETVTSTFAGSYKALPIITITLNSFTTSYTSNNMSLTLGASVLIIPKTWETDDVLIVDCENNEVTVNDTSINYYGIMPTIDSGVVDLIYTDDFDTRNVDIEVKYKARYL